MKDNNASQTKPIVIIFSNPIDRVNIICLTGHTTINHNDIFTTEWLKPSALPL